MKKRVLAEIALVAAAAAPGGQVFAQALDGSGNPLFKQFTSGTGTFALTSNSRIVLLADNQNLIETLNAERGWLDKFRYATGLGLQVTVINSASVTGNDIVLSNMTTALFSNLVGTATLTVAAGGNNAKKDIGANIRREGYEYSAGTGGVTVRFAEDLGALRAVQSLVQMVMQDGGASGGHRNLPAGTGIDYPVMEKRMFGMDVSFSFVPVDALIGYMEKMSQHKLNELHLRIAGRRKDSGGANQYFFRLDLGDSTRQDAMNHSGDFYTAQDWESLEAAAKRYGIDIIPEFPSPRREGPWTSDTQSPPASSGGDIDTRSSTRAASVTYMAGIINHFRDWFKSGKIHLGGRVSTRANWSNGVAYLNSLWSTLKSQTSPDPFAEVYIWIRSIHQDSDPMSLNDDFILSHFSGADRLERHRTNRTAGTKWVDSKEAEFFISSGQRNSYYNQDHMLPENFYDTHLPARLADYVSDNAVPDGIEAYLHPELYDNIGYGNDFMSAQLSGVIPGAGLINWHGQVRNGGTVINYSGLNYDNLIPVSQELLSYWVRERFPYLTGNQAMTILMDTTEHLKFSADNSMTTWNGNTYTLDGPVAGTRAENWMAWNQAEMDMALAGPTRFAAGMFAANIVGIGNEVNGLTCNSDACDSDVWANAIAGPGGLHKQGVGLLILDGTNTFSGGVLLEGGSLGVVSDDSLGAATSTLSFAGGTLEFYAPEIPATRNLVITTGSSAFINTGGSILTIKAAIRGSGNLVKVGRGTLVLEGANVYTGATRVADGLLGIDPARLPAASDIHAAAGATLALANSTAGSLAGAISGDGLIMKSGDGDLTLAGSSSANWQIFNGEVESEAAFSGDIQFADGPGSANSAFYFNQSGDITYAGVLSGEGLIHKEGSGTLVLSADSSSCTYCEFTLEAGILYVDGTFGDANSHVSVTGSALGGSGKIGGGVDINANGTLVGGRAGSAGKLTIGGNLRFLKDSSYRTRLDAGIIVEGDASIRETSDDSELLVLDALGSIGSQRVFTIMTVGGVLTGRFAEHTYPEDFPFMTPTVIYTAKQVQVSVSASRRSITDMIDQGDGSQPQNMANISMLGKILTEAQEDDSLPEVLEDILMRTTDINAVLAEMAAEVHASAKSAFISSSSDLSSAALAQTRAAFDALDSQDVLETRFNLERKRWGFVGEGNSAIWIKPLVSWGKNQGGANFRDIEYESASFLIGGDAAVNENLRLGFFTGFGRAEFTQPGSPNTAGEDTSQHAGFYGGGRLGNFRLRGGLSYTVHGIETSRTISDTKVGGDYRADTFGAFSEIGYRIDSFYDNTVLEPFVGFNYSSHKTDAFSEQDAGGRVAFQMDEDSTRMSGAEVGLRALVPGEMLPLLPAKSTLNWLMLYNFSLQDPDIAVPQSVGNSQAIDIRGTPVSGNRILFSGGLDMALRENVDTSVRYSYSGLAEGSGNAKHSLEARIVFRF